MNERIRELRNEAEKWVADNFSTDKLDPYEWWEKEEQKFAELIVQECIDTAFHKGHPDLEFLLKHFGVEE
jgi:hypothetical protein